MATAQDAKKVLTQFVDSHFANEAKSDARGNFKMPDQSRLIASLEKTVGNLLEYDLGLLPESTLSTLVAQCTRVITFLNVIREIVAGQSNAGNYKDRVVKTFHEETAPFETLCLMAIAYLRTEKALIEKYLAEMDNAAKGFSKKIADTEKAIAGWANSAEYQQFNKLARGHAIAAWIWMIVSALFLAGTFYVVSVLFLDARTPSDTQAIPYLLTARVVLIGLMVGGASWCAKNYRVNRHQWAVNSHRATAIATFKAFMEGTKDEEVRKSILLEAVRCVYSYRPSGYMTKTDQESVVTNFVGSLGGKSP